MSARIICSLSLLTFALAGCGDDTGTVSSGVDITCPSDQVAWTFSTEVSNQSNAWSDALKPDASVTAPLARNVVTDVSIFSCRFRDENSTTIETPRGNDFLRATLNCRDLTVCYLPTNCIDPLERLSNPGFVARQVTTQLQWTCSDGMEYSANGGLEVAKLSCPQPTAVASTRPARTACVPRVCNGSQRRDENLACVTDGTRSIIRADQVSLLDLSLTPKFLPFTTTQNGTSVKQTGAPVIDADLGHRLDRHQLYRLKTGFRFRGDVTPPTNARAVLWLSEVHTDGVDGGTTGASYAPTESFRCVVKAFDVGRHDLADGGLGPAVPDGAQGNTVTIDETLQLPDDCFNQAFAFEQQDPQTPPAARTPAPVAGLRFHLSYDLENTTFYVPAGKTQVDACAADPLDFFRKQTGLLDYLNFYRQHEVFPPAATLQQARNPLDPPVRRTSFEGFFEGSADSVRYPRDRMELGLSDARVDRPSVTVRVNSRATRYISVSADFYVALDSGGLYEQYLGPRLHPVMRVYLVPRVNGAYPGVPATGFPTIGAAAFPGNGDGRSKPDATGVTVNGRFRIDSNLTQQFLSPGTLAYVDNGMKTFEVLTCLDATAGDYWINSEYWRADRNTELGFGGVSVGNDADTAAAYAPPGFPSPGRGCRWSRTPLIVTIDRAVGVVETIDDQPWQGQANNEKNGNSSVKQSNDNDVDNTCQSLDGGLPVCDQGQSSGQQGQGDYGKSLFATSTSSVSAPGTLRMGPNGPEDDSSASAEAEILGFQVLDPDSDEPTEQWATDGIAHTRKVTFTFQPDWGPVEAAARRATGGSENPEWKQGRYAGVMGLGVGWGFKEPVGSFGLVTFTVSVGFSIALTLEVAHSFDPEGNYECIVEPPADGSAPKPCIKPGAEAVSFAAANTACQAKGGRLAEASSLEEAAVLQNFLVSNAAPGTDLWLGAQQFDEYDPSLCMFGWVEGVCRPRHKTSYRWVSNDETFASVTGNAAATINPSKLFFSGDVQNALLPRAPARAGVVFDRNANLSSAEAGSAHAYACIYDPAKSDVPIQVTAKVEAGFAAGMGVEWCYPTDEIGICLAGSFNFVAVKIAPTVTSTVHHLHDTQDRFARRSNVNLTADWSLTLLEGAVEFKVRLAAWFEFSFTLVEFSGFKAAEGKLYDFNFPVQEKFR